MADAVQQIAENLTRIRQQVAEAAERSGRTAAEVTLIGVTKYVDLELTRSVLTAGCHDLGESRPQQLWSKAERMTDASVRWHLIGHLQRNKLARVMPHVHLLHSLDSLRLATEISAWATQRQHIARVLLEVNISGDDAKHGFAPGEAAAALELLQSQAGLEVCGLMTMASLQGGPPAARRDFAALRALRDQLRRQVAGGLSLPELSMGMSDDFVAAIEEGATCVRIGSALFAGVAE